MAYTNYKLVEQYHWPNGVYRGSVERWWNRSGSPPFHSPQPYRYHLWYVTDSSASDGLNTYKPPESPGEVDDSMARNKAYEELMAGLGDTSSWGTNLAEVGQSASTAERRLLQLGNFARQLRQKNFFGAMNELKVSFIPSGVSKWKSFSDNFLEWHFGWAPMMADIHNAAQSMSSPSFGTKKLRGNSSTTSSFFVHNDRFGGNFQDLANTSSVRVKMGGKVSLSNESAFLANQMGLVNPLNVAWDLVPFSFVVDWFANVGQVLGAMSGFVGVSLSDAYTTSSQEFSYSDYQFSWGFNAETGVYDIPTYSKVVSHGLDIQRVPGISGPVLAVKPFKGFSATRGATACALLLQKMR